MSGRRGNSGIEGKDFHLGIVISRQNSKTRDEGHQIARDYRYDKILRNRSIGRQGVGMWCTWINPLYYVNRKIRTIERLDQTSDRLLPL